MVFKIRDKEVGAGRCFIVGEVGQAHDGSLALAHRYIDAVAETGVDAVKFQAHIAEYESSPQHDKFRVEAEWRQDSSRYAYWKRMEFEPDHWSGLKEHAQKRGLAFIVSPFSMQAYEIIAKVGVDAWKVASGEIVSLDMIKAMTNTGIPALISTGMATIQEIDAAKRKVGDGPVALFHCTSAYPCPPEQAQLWWINDLRVMFKVPVGLSDHSGTVAAGISAVAKGCDLLEIHAVLDRRDTGPDASSSLDMAQIRELVRGVRWIEAEKAAPHVQKNEMALGPLKEMRKLFMKSIYAARDLGTNDDIRASDLVFLKPGNGIPPSDVNTIIGRIAARPIKKGDLINPRDLLYR